MEDILFTYLNLGTLGEMTDRPFQRWRWELNLDTFNKIINFSHKTNSFMPTVPEIGCKQAIDSILEALDKLREMTDEQVTKFD